MAIPTRDPELVDWSTNFNTRITASPTTFGLVAAQATAYDVLHDAFIAAYDAHRTSVEAGVRSEALTTAKNEAKASLLQLGRELYAFIQDSLTVLDSNKNLVGVKVRKVPSVVPPPGQRPTITIVSVVGRIVRVRLGDSVEPTRKGMPDGVIGAVIVSATGDDEPTEASIWAYQGTTGQLVAELSFPPTLADGSKVWVSAAWMNYRKQNGPFAVPISTNLQGGAAAAA